MNLLVVDIKVYTHSYIFLSLSFVAQMNANGFDTIIEYPLFESFVLSMSAAFESDEDFIALVRNLFTFTSLKPPPPQYKMSHKSSSSTATPAAKQVFGDFISWNQTESVKERGQPSRIAKFVSDVYFACDTTLSSKLCFVTLFACHL